ncbi:Os01g0931100, partial [Oryza sativa Japonica Group]
LIADRFQFQQSVGISLPDLLFFLSTRGTTRAAFCLRPLLLLCEIVRWGWTAVARASRGGTARWRRRIPTAAAATARGKKVTTTASTSTRRRLRLAGPAGGSRRSTSSVASPSL